MPSRAELFQRERWSLIIELDSFEEEQRVDSEPSILGERAELEAFVLRDFGGLPEELPEIWLDHEDGRIEISTDVLDFVAGVFHWLADHTRPRKITLVRNEDRGGPSYDSGS